jgi:hypothetical protein
LEKEDLVNRSSENERGGKKFLNLGKKVESVQKGRKEKEIEKEIEKDCKNLFKKLLQRFPLNELFQS